MATTGSCAARWRTSAVCPDVSGPSGSDDGRTVGLWGAVAIGVGGMVGGGIFAVLGLSVQITRGGAPVAFLIAGAVALVTARAYIRLSRRFPRRGGTVVFVNEAFGRGLFSGSVNVLLWISYIAMLSLYASAFGSYAASFFPSSVQPVMRHVWLSGAIVAITGLNLLSADVIARAERWIVGIKVAILVLFVAVGTASISPSRLAPGAWSSPLSLVAGGMVIFLAYEGFELIANSAEDVVDPQHTLPRAFLIAVGFVIVLYVAVAAVSVGALPVAKIVDARDYALAAAARPSLGQAGFTLIAVAALLSTASAINATLYGSARLTYSIARSGELPAQLERTVWNEPIEGLLVTAGLTLLVGNLFDLTRISTMGSAGFLLVFAIVNLADARLTDGDGQTRGGRVMGSGRAIPIVGAVACLGALTTLVVRSALGDVAVLAGMVVLAVVIEASVRGLGRHEMEV